MDSEPRYPFPDQDFYYRVPDPDEDPSFDDHKILLTVKFLYFSGRGTGTSYQVPTCVMFYRKHCLHYCLRYTF
jgi:hypothetical protein